MLLSSFGSRGDVEPMLGLAVQLRAHGAQVRVCAPPDFAELLAEVGVSFVLAGPSVRRITAGPDRWQPSDIKQRATELLAAQYRTVCTAAADCDVVVATGLFPATAAARDRAAAVAHTIRADGAAVAAHRLITTYSRDMPPVSA